MSNRGVILIQVANALDQITLASDHMYFLFIIFKNMQIDSPILNR